MDQRLKTWRGPRQRKGYTIMEVLVALILLVIALPGLVVMMTSSRKAQVASFRMDQAMSVGQQILDSLALLPPGARAPGAASRTLTVGSVPYTASWTLPAGAGGVWNFPLTVSWTQGGANHQVVLQGVLR